MKYVVSLLVLLTVVSGSAFAGGKSNIMRGGLGFLFPDHNSFDNPGQLALDKGTSVEGKYSMSKASGVSTVAAESSFVYSSGKFGFGAFGERAGTSLTNTGGFVDIVGGGLGFALAKDRLTFGVGGYRQLTTGATSDGLVGASLTWNGAKHMGLSLGVGGDTTLNATPSDTRRATAGIGYGFKSTASVEANLVVNDINNTSDWNAKGFLNLSGQMIYFSGGVDYAALAKTYDLLGRIGLVFGKFDVSATVTYPTLAGSDPTYGGTLRITF